MANEMEDLVVNHKVGQIAFTDDNFLGPREEGNPRALSLGREILRRGLATQFSVLARVDSLEEGLLRFLKLAGLRSLFVGFESGVDRALKTFGKGITAKDNREAIKLVKRMGIRCFPGFIMFDPYTTLEEIRQNLEFVDFAEADTDLIRIDDLLGSLQPFTGTPIKEKLHREGRLIFPDSELVPEDVIPTYRIEDPRVEALRRGMKQVRKSMTRPLFDQVAIMERRRAKGQMEPDKADEFDRIQEQFNRLVKKMRAFEKNHFRESAGMAEEIRKLSPDSHQPIVEKASTEVKSLNCQVREINREVERLWDESPTPSA